MVLAQMVLQLWTPAFGTESHQSHLNPLYDSSANISNEDRAARVARTVESMNSASFVKASEPCERLTVLSTVLQVVCTNKALLFTLKRDGC